MHEGHGHIHSLIKTLTCYCDEQVDSTMQTYNIQDMKI